LPPDFTVHGIQALDSGGQGKKLPGRSDLDRLHHNAVIFRIQKIGNGGQGSLHLEYSGGDLRMILRILPVLRPLPPDAADNVRGEGDSYRRLRPGPDHSLPDMQQSRQPRLHGGAEHGQDYSAFMLHRTPASLFTGEPIRNSHGKKFSCIPGRLSARIVLLSVW